MTSKTEFIKVALLPKLVKVSVHFEAAISTITDQVDVMAYIKQREVERVVYAANLKVDQIGQCLHFLNQLQGRSKLEISTALMNSLKSLTGRQPKENDAKKSAREILQLMKVLELVDDDLYATLDGVRLLGYLQNSRPKFLDYLAWLLLTRGGWVRVVSEIDQLRRSVWYGLGMKDLTDLLHDELRKAGLVKRTDSWQMSALIDCLVYLRLLKPWDAVQMRFNPDKERLYDLLRKTFT